VISQLCQLSSICLISGDDGGICDMTGAITGDMKGAITGDITVDIT
jgi:hypothetical protein